MDLNVDSKDDSQDEVKKGNKESETGGEGPGESIAELEAIKEREKESKNEEERKEETLPESLSESKEIVVDESKTIEVTPSSDIRAKHKSAHNTNIEKSIVATEEKIGVPKSSLGLQSNANETNDSTEVDIENDGKSKKEKKITISKSNDESVGKDKTKGRSGLLSPERLLQTKWNFTKSRKRAERMKMKRKKRGGEGTNGGSKTPGGRRK